MMTPIRLIKFSVPCVASKASTTPINDSGSDSMTGIGARKEPNWITSTRYIKRTPENSAMPMAVNISCWSREAPPSSMP